MAHGLAEAQPRWQLRVRATSIQAVAHAFVLLRLISQEGADAAIARASRALGLHGVGGPEPAIRPGPARDYWNMRAEGHHALAWIPGAVAPGPLRLPVAAADLRCDWFRTARVGVRFQVQGAARPPAPGGRQRGSGRTTAPP